MQNAVNWFELPSTDFNRAVHFYETILAVHLKQEIFGGDPNAMFPVQQADGEDAAGGAIIYRAGSKPSTDGALVYLNAAGQMDTILGRIESAGGKVLLPRTSIGDPGFIAIFLDSEGNKVALHQPN